MGSYLISVMTAVVAGTAAELLPDEEGGMDRPLRLIVSLLILCVIVLPLVDQFPNGEGLLAWLDALHEKANASPADAYAAQTMAYIRSAAADAAETEITALLAERFGLPAEGCRVEVTLAEGEGGVELAGMKVWLSGRAVLSDAAGMEAYLAALFGGKCIVVIE